MIKKIIKKIAGDLGFCVSKKNYHSSKSLQINEFLNFNKIKNIIDVGANVGQFAMERFDSGFSGEIYSIEPLSSAHTVLTQNAIGRSRWHILPRLAIGGRDGEVSINISRNSVSSSILPILSSHIVAEKDSIYIGSEEVKLRTLDFIINEYLGGLDGLCIKIDAQGYEGDIISGLDTKVGLVKSIICEVSMVPLYGKQSDWLDVCIRLNSLGFKTWAIHQEFIDSDSGRTLQCEILFIREGQ